MHLVVANRYLCRLPGAGNQPAEFVKPFRSVGRGEYECSHAVGDLSEDGHHNLVEIDHAEQDNVDVTRYLTLFHGGEPGSVLVPQAQVAKRNVIGVLSAPDSGPPRLVGKTADGRGLM